MKCRACNIREAMPRNLFCEPCCETPDGWTSKEPTVSGVYWYWDREHSKQPEAAEVMVHTDPHVRFSVRYFGGGDPCYAWEFDRTGTLWFGPITPPPPPGARPVPVPMPPPRPIAPPGTLAAAVQRARGGPPPVPRTGFA